MTASADKLVAALAAVADDLDARGYLAAGVIRQAARVLVEQPTGHDEDPDRCPTCGGPVTQTNRGRRRIYCSVGCRRRARKERVMGSSKT